MTIKIGTYRTEENDFIDMTKPETQDWMKSNYPAIMSDRPVGMSDGYQFMPSHKIALSLQENFGVQLVEVGQQWSRSRHPSGQEHFMKFRMPADMISLAEGSDSVPELVLMNSHNGRSTIRVYAGLFRFVCANGMVVSERSFGQIKLRHFGEKNSYKEFGKMLTAMTRGLVILSSRIDRMKEVILTKHYQNQLAKMMIETRGVPDWMEAKDVLTIHRPEDEVEEGGKRDLWRTFNVIQENLTSKSIGHVIDEGRNRSIRAITGARAHVLVNEKLWASLEDFIEARFPALAKEALGAIIEAKAIPEEKPTEIRNFEQLISLSTFAEAEQVTDAERASLDPDQRTKLAKRKSYLKSKEKVTA